MLGSVFLLACVLGSTRALTCIGCTSDNGNNIGCEENSGNQSMIECPDEKTHCYVMVQNLKTSGNAIVWNRSCCTPKDDAADCPTNKPSHQDNEFYEIWRKTCSTDNCNTMDPRESSEEGGGTVIVRGKSSASALLGSLMMVFGALVVM